MSTIFSPVLICVCLHYIKDIQFRQKNYLIWYLPIWNCNAHSHLSVQNVWNCKTKVCSRGTQEFHCQDVFFRTKFFVKFFFSDGISFVWTIFPSLFYKIFCFALRASRVRRKASSWISIIFWPYFSVNATYDWSHGTRFVLMTVCFP